MKKIIILVLFLFFCELSFSQKRIELINALTKESSYIGIDFAYDCVISIETKINANEKLLLYGYQKCETDEKVDFYKAYWNELTYLINTENVVLKPEDEIYLKSLDYNDDLAMYEKISAITEKKTDSISKINASKAKNYRSKGKENGLLIKYSNVFDQSEYTNGTGYEISFINLSKKTIKYASFTVKGINAVNDIVSTKTIKGIGPINPNEVVKYSYDYVWHTDIVEKSKLSIIKIEYMDGSIKTIQNAENLIVPKTLHDLLFENED